MLQHIGAAEVDESQRRPDGALDPRLHDVLVHIEVDGHDGHLVHENVLSLMEHLRARDRIRHLERTEDQVIIGFVAPSGIVVAVGRRPHVEEGHGVHVVADPAGACHLIVERVARGQVHAPLLVGELDVDAQVLLPHLLDGFGDLLMVLAGVVENRQRREALAIGISSVGQQLLRDCNVLLDVVVPGHGPEVGAWLAVSQPEGDIGKCRFLTASGHAVDEHLAIDRHGESLADFDIANRRLSDVEHVVVGANIRRAEQGTFLLKARNLGNRRIVEPVELARLEHRQRCLAVVDEVEHELV